MMGVGGGSWGSEGWEVSLVGSQRAPVPPPRPRVSLGWATSLPGLPGPLLAVVPEGPATPIPKGPIP